jgi:hypothetical protein
LLTHREDEFQHIGVSLAVDDALLDVQHERPRRLEDALQLGGDGQEPLDILVGVDAAVDMLALVGVGRRGDDEIDAGVRQLRQHRAAVAVQDSVHKPRK